MAWEFGMAERKNSFARAREDHRTEMAEDYVELIFRLEQPDGSGVRNADLVQALGDSQPTVTKALERLLADGLVTFEPRSRIHLSPAGRELATACLRRHKLVVEFLKFIGVPDLQAELDAEGIEHHVSTVSLEAMQRWLDQRS